MKHVAFWLAVFFAGALAALATEYTVGWLWVNLEWRKPVADWLLSLGVPPKLAVNYWSLTWVKMPDWFAACIIGGLIGKKLSARRWLPAALACGAGFFMYGLVVNIPYVLSLHEHDVSLAWGTFIELIKWGLPIIGLMTLAAWIFRRRKSPVLATQAATPG